MGKHFKSLRSGCSDREVAGALLSDEIAAIAIIREGVAAVEREHGPIVEAIERTQQAGEEVDPTLLWAQKAKAALS